MKAATTVRDPVCGMDVEPTTAASHTEHDGQTYHFCSAGCKKAFDLNPKQYAGESAGPRKSGHGCCN